MSNPQTPSTTNPLTQHSALSTQRFSLSHFDKIVLLVSVVLMAFIALTILLGDRIGVTLDRVGPLGLARTWLISPRLLACLTTSGLPILLIPHPQNRLPSVRQAFSTTASARTAVKSLFPNATPIPAHPMSSCSTWIPMPSSS